MLSIGSVVMNVEVDRALRFWMQALDYLPKREIKAEDDFVILVPGRGQGAQLALNLTEVPAPQWPTRRATGSASSTPRATEAP